MRYLRVVAILAVALGCKKTRPQPSATAAPAPTAAATVEEPERTAPAATPDPEPAGEPVAVAAAAAAKTDGPAQRRFDPAAVQAAVNGVMPQFAQCLTGGGN